MSNMGNFLVNLKEMADKIKEATKVDVDRRSTWLVTSHVRPDIDAVTSMLAVGALLEYYSFKVRYVLEDWVPRIARSLPGVEKIYNVSRVEGESYEVAVVVDTACGADRIGPRVHNLITDKTFVINIDHHPTSLGQKVEHERYILHCNKEASSTTEIIFQLFQELEVVIRPEVAECVYRGIISDTGNFSYGTTSKTHLVVSELVEIFDHFSIDLQEIRKKIFPRRTEDDIRFQGYIFSNFELEDGFAHVFVPEEVSDSHDTELNPANFLLRIAGCEVVLLMRELNGELQCSLRSDGPDVSVIAEHFGGGGHEPSAGFTTNKSPEEVVSIVKGMIG